MTTTTIQAGALVTLLGTPRFRQEQRRYRSMVTGGIHPWEVKPE